MTPSKDSRRPQRAGWRAAMRALVLLASVCWLRPSAADPRIAGADASGTVGAGPVTALVIDPQTHTTLYAGTVCSGVLKSLDGADSWSVVNTGLTNQYVNALAIAPTTPATLYVGTWNGAVFRSLNRGSSWQATPLSAWQRIKSQPGSTSNTTDRLAVSDG
jgi:hypothetical protein